MMWEKYYTPEVLAEEIISLIPFDFYPAVVVDVCAGQGNFLDQAKKRWPFSDFIAVDINPNTKLEEKQFESYKLDALDIKKLKSTVLQKSYNKKLVLANPPFGYKRSGYTIAGDFVNLFEEAKKLNRIEALILVSNVNLLSYGDYFGGVIPENIFVSSRYSNFKDLFISLFDNVYISKVYQSFRKSEVRTRIFIGRFIGGERKKLVEAETPFIKVGNDKLFRGIDNSKLKKCSEKLENKIYAEVLHFNSSSLNNVKYKYIEFNEHLNKYRIKNKDILVLRVGRNAGKVFWDTSELRGKLFSDHFIIIRGGLIKKRKPFISYISEKTKGLTAKYITNKDIEVYINKLEGKKNSFH